MGESPTSEEISILRRIEHNTAVPWYSAMWIGLLRGAGFTLGGVLVVALLGWLLSFLGIIPGLGDMVHYLRIILHAHSGLQ